VRSGVEIIDEQEEGPLERRDQRKAAELMLGARRKYELAGSPSKAVGR
jgi:hypothetical protein